MVTQTEKIADTRLTRVEFRVGDGNAPVAHLKLEGIASEIHAHPERLGEIMALLDLPEGTTAVVTVEASSSIVR